MLNRSASLAMSTSVLKALPGKLDIKRHSPSILFVIVAFPGHTHLISNRSAWFKPRCVVCRVKSDKFGQTANSDSHFAYFIVQLLE